MCAQPPQKGRQEMTSELGRARKVFLFAPPALVFFSLLVSGCAWILNLLKILSVRKKATN
jgi:hypothetical protein